MTTIRSEKRIAPLDEREIRLLRSRRPWLFFLLMLAVDAMVIAGMVVMAFSSPGFLTFWVMIAMLAVVLVLALTTLHAEAEWRFLRRDLETGVKVYRNGRIGSLHTRDDGESPTVYRIGIVGNDPEASLGFSVPETVYRAVAEGQAVRVAHAPLSRVLLELSTGEYVYSATDAKYGKAPPRTAVSDRLSAH